MQAIITRTAGIVIVAVLALTQTAATIQPCSGVIQVNAATNDSSSEPLTLDCGDVTIKVTYASPRQVVSDVEVPAQVTYSCESSSRRRVRGKLLMLLLDRAGCGIGDADASIDMPRAPKRGSVGEIGSTSLSTYAGICDKPTVPAKLRIDLVVEEPRR